MILRGAPAYVSVYNGPEFIALALRELHRARQALDNGYTHSP